MKNKQITNRERSVLSSFIEDCTKVNIKPTIRQASKYKRKKGYLFKALKQGKNIHLPLQVRLKE